MYTRRTQPMRALRASTQLACRTCSGCTCSSDTRPCKTAEATSRVHSVDRGGYPPHPIPKESEKEQPFLKLFWAGHATAINTVSFNLANNSEGQGLSVFTFFPLQITSKGASVGDPGTGPPVLSGHDAQVGLAFRVLFPQAEEAKGQDEAIPSPAPTNYCPWTPATLLTPKRAENPGPLDRPEVGADHGTASVSRPGRFRQKALASASRGRPPGGTVAAPAAPGPRPARG